MRLRRLRMRKSRLGLISEVIVSIVAVGRLDLITLTEIREIDACTMARMIVEVTRRSIVAIGLNSIGAIINGCRRIGAR